MLELCSLNPTQISRKFSTALEGDIDDAIENVINGRFEIYTDGNVFLMVEFNTDEGFMYLVALVGKNSKGIINGVVQYLKANNMDLVFKTRKKSVYKLFKYLNPLKVGQDNDLVIYRIFTNG